MFDTLSNRLADVFKKLTGKGALTEDDVNTAMREVRIALLEADVALPVVKQFVEEVKQKAIGQEVVRSVTPGQMVIKIVHDHLVQLLGGDTAELAINVPPAVMLMCGLQGSGKTTTSGKLAKRLKEKHNKKVLLASLDVYRPAAQHQLATLAERVGVASLPIVEGEKPEAITERALKEARTRGYDVLILDTAGRLHIDDELMEELKQVAKRAKPQEILLVADAMTGQDAVRVAESFKAAVALTGLVLTRMDGDARGGAALSMRSVTGCPIKFMGMGEKIDDLQPFHPDRVAGRILDMGDVVSLVERAAEVMDQAEAEKIAARMQKGQFDMNDLLSQLRQLKKMGGMSSMMSMIPGLGGLKEKMGDLPTDDKPLARQEAIILAMTPKERKNPDLINASRKRRIANGSGTNVQEVNRMLKQHKQMQVMMKQFKKLGPKGMMRQMAQMQRGMR